MNNPQSYILLVEDNEQDEVLTIRALRKNNILNNIEVCRDGAEALEFLHGPGSGERPLPQVVLLDLKLPKVNGLEVLQQIRSNHRTRRLPVVMLTTSKEDSDLAQSYDLGVNSYVRKPVDFNQFMEAVKNLGLYWMIINERPIE
jgi:two-component system, response regulator